MITDLSEDYIVEPTGGQYVKLEIFGLGIVAQFLANFLQCDHVTFGEQKLGFSRKVDSDRIFLEKTFRVNMRK